MAFIQHVIAWTEHRPPARATSLVLPLSPHNSVYVRACRRVSSVRATPSCRSAPAVGLSLRESPTIVVSVALWVPTAAAVSGGNPLLPRTPATTQGDRQGRQVLMVTMFLAKKVLIVTDLLAKWVFLVTMLFAWQVSLCDDASGMASFPGDGASCKAGFPCDDASCM